MGMTRKRYLDFVRCLATLAIVFSHCGGGGSETAEIVIHMFVHWSIPLFVMITGSLFLDKKSELTEKKILTKTLPRILAVIALWGLFYNIISLTFINGFSLDVIKKALIMVICGDTTFCYQFWYLYFIVGVYLILPVVKPWIDKEMNTPEPTAEVKSVFAVMLVFSVVIPTVKEFFGWDFVDWYGAFAFFGKGLFYVFCGAWLSKWLLPKLYRMILLIVVIGQWIWMFYYVATGEYDKVWKVWYDNSVYAFCFAALLFDTAHRIDFDKWGEKAATVLEKLSSYSFGVYILHPMVIWGLTKVPFMNNWSNPVLNSFAVVAVSTSVCLAVTAILKKIPLLKNIV